MLNFTFAFKAYTFSKKSKIKSAYSSSLFPASKYTEQVTTALVSQTMYQDVRDGYAVYFFKEEAEAQALQLCEETE